MFEKYINCIDAHTAGEPLRIITSGFPSIPGETMLEKRDYVKNNLDDLRKLIMLEPRGHNDMYGCIITSPTTSDGDFGVLFTHNDGLSTMCGHGIIAVTKVVARTGFIQLNDKKKIKIDTPAGRIIANINYEDEDIESISFLNVPSFVYKDNVKLNLGEIGNITVDIVYGGAFYAFVESKLLDVKINPNNAKRLTELGMIIKNKIMDKMIVKHPIKKDISGIYGTIITDPLEIKNNDVISKNVCIFADGQVDRSPTGTGTSARVALLQQKGNLDIDKILINKSIIETIFEGKIVKNTKIDNFSGVIPEIKGNAYITGFNNLVLENNDRLSSGFKIN